MNLKTPVTLLVTWFLAAPAFSQSLTLDHLHKVLRTPNVLETSRHSILSKDVSVAKVFAYDFGEAIRPPVRKINAEALADAELFPEPMLGDLIVNGWDVQSQGGYNNKDIIEALIKSVTPQHRELVAKVFADGNYELYRYVVINTESEPYGWDFYAIKDAKGGYTEQSQVLFLTIGFGD